MGLHSRRHKAHSRRRPNRRRNHALGLLAVVAALVVGGIAYGWAADLSVYVVRDDGMAPTLRAGSLTIDEPARGLRPNYLVTVVDRGRAVAGRVVQDLPGGAVEARLVSGSTADPVRVSHGRVLGRVVATIPVAGFAALYVRTASGAATLGVLLVGLMVLWRLVTSTPVATPPELPEGQAEPTSEGSADENELPRSA